MRQDAIFGLVYIHHCRSSSTDCDSDHTTSTATAESVDGYSSNSSLPSLCSDSDDKDYGDDDGTVVAPSTLSLWSFSVFLRLKSEKIEVIPRIELKSINLSTCSGNLLDL